MEWNIPKILEARDIYRIKRAIRCCEQELRAKLTNYNEQWTRHLKDEGGSCYCLASEISCLPEKIKELKEILGE